MPVLAKDLRYGPFLPDLPDYNSPGSNTINNVLPVAGGYEPMFDLNEIGGALGGTPLGAFTALDVSGNVNNFAGDVDALYKQNSSLDWDDISKVGGYATSAGNYWNFTQFSDQVIACNLFDNTQEYTLASSALFADLAGTPPKAKYPFVVKDFLVFAFIDEAGVIDPYGLRWSAKGNIANYPAIGSDAARAVLSDRVTLEANFGQITGAISGLQGGDAVIFQERGLTRMLFTGAPFFFSFDQIEGSRGTKAENGIVQIGGYCFYLGEDGFYAFDGVNSRPIGAQKVDRFFFKDLAAGGGNFKQIFGTADPTKKLIYWFYPGEGSSSDQPNKVLVYSWDTDEWSFGDSYEVSFVSNALSNGFTLEDLDTISTNLDLLPASLDDPIFQGGDLRIGAWTTDNKFASFTGSTFEALLNTKETQLSQADRTSFIREIWPHVQASDDNLISSSLGFRYKTNDAIVYSGFSSINQMGFCPVRSRARFGSVRTKISAGADWSFITSTDIIGQVKGRR